MSAPPGRRERKKQLTRRAISDVATRLFMERGFDAVTVAEIAAAADVAVQTVFNHFPTKEDLIFDEREWVAGPAAALEGAAPGTPRAAALETYYRGMLEARRVAGHLPTTVRFMRTIEASEALLARRARQSEEMQALIAAVGDGPPDWRRELFAAQFSAIQQVLNDELNRLLEAHVDDPDSVIELISPTVSEAFATLHDLSTGAS